MVTDPSDYGEEVKENSKYVMLSAPNGIPKVRLTLVPFTGPKEKL
jgi:hypothetical protein